MQAFEVPVGRSVLVAALAVGAIAAMPQRHHPDHHRLVLHAVSSPDALYLSAWMDGPVELELDADHLRPLRFDMRANVSDGCRWRGWETLTPIGDHRYAYAYDDEKLSCAPHPIATVHTPRIGWVEVQ
ncbi:MAG: hypothetical protein ABI467_18180 [Kofleriaceae bacterium]